MSCGLISGPASQVAQQGLAEVQRFAIDAVQRVETASDSLQDFINALLPVSEDVKLDDIGDLSSPYFVGPQPNRPDFGITVPEIDYEADTQDVTFVQTAQYPGDFTKQAPDLDFGVRPGEVTQDAPGTAPTVPQRVMPDAPDDDIPPLPSLRDIKIPTLLELTLPTFSEVAPEDPVIGEIPTFAWTEDEREKVIQDEVVDQLQAILGGSTGIPDGIWDMIWARARRQAYKQWRATNEEISTRYSSAGHMIPTGAQRKREKELDDALHESVSETARSEAIRDSQIYVERLNNALAQGIALEGQLMNLHSSQASRSLQAAQLVSTIAIQAAGLTIELYNARMAGFATKAQVFAEVMRGELAKLEVFKAELDAQRLIGDLNLQDLEAYKTQVSALESTYALYTEQVRAVIAQYDADKTRVEAFGEEVRAYESIQRAKEVEWRGYGETVKAEVAKVDAFKAESDAHLSRIRGYEISINADQSRTNAEIETERLKIERTRSALDKVRILLDSELARVTNEREAYDADARMYQTSGDIERNRVASDDRRFELLLRNAEIRATTEFRNLEARVNEALKLTDQQLGSLANILQANAQIGSSSLSALNYSASISDGVSNSTSCSTTFSN